MVVRESGGGGRTRALGARLLSHLDYDEVPRGLRTYLIAVSVLGPLVALLAAASDGWPTASQALLAVVFTGFALVAERYPLHLTHKTNINVATTAYVAMLVTLPLALIPFLALVAATGAQILRLRADRRLGLAEPLFNIGQLCLYVGASALAVALGAESLPGPRLGGAVALGAIVAGSAVLHLGNTGLVSVAAGLQLGISPARVWWHNLSLDLTPHVTLTTFGVMTGLVGLEMPLVLPLLIVPAILVHQAVRHTVRLRVDTHEALASLVEVVELRDPYTAGHSRRVATTARLLALRLGLTAEEADVVESAGRVHDIGKVAVDPFVLRKPGSLTSAEWAEMRQHPTLGANVVERFAAYQRGTAFVRHHHEAWDGTGYPDGLAGEAIPLGARILAVADTFDALTSDRPYRPGMSPALAMAVLRAGAGTQWDAQVVARLTALIAESPGEVPLFRRAETAATVFSVGEAPEAMAPDTARAA